jgi:hypothetical protein
MARMRRIALGLLVAYAASMTLYASRMSAEVFLYRRLFEKSVQADPSRMSSGEPLMRITRDYGLDLTFLEYWALRIADIQGLLMVPAIVLFFLLGLGAALVPSPSRSKPEKD